MSRGGTKAQASQWICSVCGKQVDSATIINKATTPKIEGRNRYCKHCRKHTPQNTKAEKSGSLGLARNK
ncbi:MAG: hypothetical protein WCV72_00610 [Patescibacteria group bacterium]|jgi:ribosomal protein L33